MFDTHCHLDSPRFDSDREEVLARARVQGVTELCIPSVGPEAWEPLLAWAKARAQIHVALGIHPQLLPELDPKDDERHLSRLESLLERGGAVAIGECGLDGPSVPGSRGPGGAADRGSSAFGAPMDRQVAVLRRHLELARRFHLPVLLHCLRAHEPLLALLAQEGLPQGGVLHSYSGSAEQVRDYLPFHLHFSFAGPITYERAKKPVLAARAVPRELLVIETDAPDQTPRPSGSPGPGGGADRGTSSLGRCEPAHLRRVAEGVALALGVPFDEVALLTEANARALFRLA
jgi:TatD DNase family protein